MVYIYLPSPCYTDGNSFRFFFFFFLPRSLDPPSLHSLLCAVYLGFHSVVFTVGTVESKRASAGKVKCVSDALASTLIPPDPPIPPTPRPRCTKPLPHPSGSRLLLVWPRLSEHFDKVLGVGDKHPPPRQVDGVCRSQFAPSGGQFGPSAHRAGGQRDTLRRPRRSPQGPPCHSESTIGKVGARRREQERPKTACRRARKILFIFLYYYYLFAGKHLVAQRGLVFGRGFM